jgi:3-hydroxyacyl-CoA dehydrogenase
MVNRLQAAVLLEAWRLVKEGYCSVEDLDTCIKDGLGLRWSFMGPFETIDLNAPGGVADYAARYGPSMYESLRDTRYEPWGAALISTIEAERRALLPRSGLAGRAVWRDRRLMARRARLRHA